MSHRPIFRDAMDLNASLTSLDFALPSYDRGAPRAQCDEHAPPRQGALISNPFLNHPIISGVVATLLAAAIVALLDALWRVRSEDLTVDVTQALTCEPYWVPNGTPDTVPLPNPEEGLSQERCKWLYRPEGQRESP